VLTSLASLFTGMSMYCVMIYMPQYLQIVKRMSPTASGLMTLPMVLGLLVASITSGRVVTVTGRWKAFPCAGLLLVATGMVALSRIHVGTSGVVIGADIAVVGIGLGLSMQILILAAQNAVRPADLAAATSGVSFFRALGGALGVAAFGAILTGRLRGEMSALLRAAHLDGAGGGRGTAVDLGAPEAINRLPAPILHIVHESFTRAMETVFLAAVPVTLLGFLAAIALKELPLRSARSKVRLDPDS
jgi:hypothetical protein